MELPDPVIEEHEGFLVVRDDLIEGGTKCRALFNVLANIPEKEIVYAATAYGQGQLALAEAGRDLGKDVTLFMAARKNFKKTPLVTDAMKAGAHYEFVPFPNFLNVVCNRAETYATEKGARLMTLGFAMNEFSAELVRIARSLPVTPTEVWTVGGSGTLARAFQQAWPDAKINAVTLGMKNGKMGNATVWHAPEKFEEKAKFPPPYPASPNYDAKVWQFVKKYASPGALIWNAGR